MAPGAILFAQGHQFGVLVPSCWPLGVLINPPRVNDDNDDVSDEGGEGWKTHFS